MSPVEYIVPGIITALGYLVSTGMMYYWLHIYTPIIFIPNELIQFPNICGRATGIAPNSMTREKYIVPEIINALVASSLHVYNILVAAHMLHSYSFPNELTYISSLMLSARATSIKVQYFDSGKLYCTRNNHCFVNIWPPQVLLSSGCTYAALLSIP